MKKEVKQSKNQLLRLFWQLLKEEENNVMWGDSRREL